MRLLELGTLSTIIPLAIQAMAISTMSSLLWIHDNNVGSIVGRLELLHLCNQLKCDLLDFGLATRQSAGRSENEKAIIERIETAKHILDRVRSSSLLSHAQQIRSVMEGLNTEAIGGSNPDVLKLLPSKYQKLDAEMQSLETMRITLPDSLFGAVRTTTFVATSSFLAAAVCGFFLMSSIKGSLNIIKENCSRHLNNSSLLKLDSGIRELELLDKNFREMFVTVENILKAEKALFDNTQDTIFSLAKEGVFIAANPATIKLIGAVVGSNIGSVMLSSEFVELQKVFSNSISSSAPCRCNLSLRSETAIHIMEASVQWSQYNQTFYVIARDISQEREIEQLKAEFFRRIRQHLSEPLLELEATATALLAGENAELTVRGITVVTTTQTSLRRLIHMLRDLKCLSELERFDLTICPNPTAIADLLQEATSEMMAFAAARRITVSYIACPGSVVLDRERMMQVLINLLSNAIKFSAQNTKISVNAEKTETELTIAVCDQGKGIPHDELPSLFGRFQQGASGGIPGGTGLGLYICKQIVERHNGIIEVLSESSKGTTFVVRIPIVQPL